MTSLDVSPADLLIIKEILRRHVPDRRVWAFGSRVSGKARRYSDLDLCIIGESRLDRATLAALAEAFSESDLAYKVDLLDWAALDSSFRQIIAASHAVL